MLASATADMHNAARTTLHIRNNFIIQRLPSLGIDVVADCTAETSNAIAFEVRIGLSSTTFRDTRRKRAGLIQQPQ
jgi:hypothetical protein